MQSLLDFSESYGLLIGAEKDRLEYLSELVEHLTLDEDLLPYLESFHENVSKTVNKSPERSPDSPKNSKIMKSLPMRDHIFTDNSYSNSLWYNLGSYEEKRRKLAEERRKEYNEYLKEKAKYDLQRKHKQRTEDAGFQINFLNDAYKEILERKRQEEKEYRERNCLNSIEEENHLVINRSPSPPSPLAFIPSSTASRSRYTPYMLGDEEEEDAGDDLRRHITPRSRLLTTKSSREKAALYKEELFQQIQDKKRREEEEKEKARREEAKLDAIVREQQRRLQMEFEEEQKRLKQKTNEYVDDLVPKLTKVSAAKSVRRMTGSLHTTRSSQVKSPTKSALKQQSKPKTRSPLRLPIGIDVVNKASATKEGLTKEIGKGSTQNEHRISNGGGGDNGNSFNGNQRHLPVLARLAEVRKQMQENHARMIQQLREKRTV